MTRRIFVLVLVLSSCSSLPALSLEFQSGVSATTERATPPEPEVFALLTQNVAIVSDRRTWLPGLESILDWGWGWRTGAGTGTEFHGQLNQGYLDWAVSDSLWLSLGKRRLSTSVLLFRSFVDLLAQPSPFAFDPRLPSLEPIEHFEEGRWMVTAESDWGEWHGLAAWIPATSALPESSGFFRFNLEQQQSGFYAALSGRVGDLDARVLYWQPLGGKASQGAITAEWVPIDALALKGEAALSRSLERVDVISTAGAFEQTSTEWVPQGGLGVTVTTPADHSFRVEYNYNGLGFLGLEYDEVIQTAGNNPSVLRDQGLWLAARHYLFTQQDWGLSHKVRFRLQSLTNLQDGSGFWGVELHVPWDDWELTANTHALYGNTASEAGRLPRSVTAHLMAKFKLVS